MNIFTSIIEQGKKSSRLFQSWDSFHEATFSPEVEIVAMLPLMVHGNTYAERRESLRQLAIDVHANDDGGLAWSEYTLIGDFFERNAKQLGLVCEFRENGVI